MIQHNRPTLSREEEQAATRVLRSGWLSQGREVEAFETEFCEYLGLAPGHAVAVGNGTSALFLALWALGSKGKSAAFPAYVCSAVRHAVAMAGAEEQLLDSGRDNPNIDLFALKNSGAKIAIVPHLYGIPIDASGLKGVDIIEDCCQALGARVKGVPVGLQGRIGIYSFYVTKLMTSGGQGGMVVSHDRSLIEAVRDYRQFDMRHDRRKRFNFQMTDLQAAIGRVQLRRFPSFMTRRQEIFEQYRKAGLDLLDVAPALTRELQPVRYRAIVKTAHATETLSSLKRAGIEAINPLEEWEILGDPKDFPVAREWTHETLSLPIYPSLSDAAVARIVRGVSR